MGRRIALLSGLGVLIAPIAPAAGHAQQPYDQQLASYKACAEATLEADPGGDDWPTAAEADAAIAICETTLTYMEETLERPDLSLALHAYSLYWAGDTHRQLGFLMGARQMGETGTVTAEPAMCAHAFKALSYATTLEAMKFDTEDARTVIDDLVAELRKKANIIAGYCG